MNIIKFTKEIPEFKAIAFVLRSISTNKTREVMNNVHVEQEEEGIIRMVATDGCRLHTAILPSIIEPGDYSISVNNSKEIILEKDTKPTFFPNWRRVHPILNTKLNILNSIGDYKYIETNMDNENPVEKIIYEFPESIKKYSLLYSKTVCKIIRDTQATIDIKFLNDLVGFDYTIAIASCEAWNHAIYFKGNNIDATIMPISR